VVSPEGADAPVDETAPRRLDPRTLLLLPFRTGWASLFLGLPALLAFSRGEGLNPGLLMIGLTLFLIVSAVGGVLSWLTFTYQVLPDQVVIARGLLNRSRRSIPAERIQDVSITQGPLSRLIGLADVKIETGGGEADEGVLSSVSLAEARRLREVLRRRAPAPAAVGGTTAEAAEDEAVLFRLGLGRLLFSGLFKFSLVWIAAILGLLQYGAEVTSYDWEWWLSRLRDVEGEVRARADPQFGLWVVAAAVALGLVTGVGRTVLRNFGFTLTEDPRRFRVRRGLLTRSEVAVAKRQIQLGLIERGPVSGRLGWRAFRVQTLGGGGEASGMQDLLPFARPREMAPVVETAGLPPFREAGLARVSGAHAVSGVIGFALIPALMIGAASLFFPLALLLMPLTVLGLIVALLRPGRHRFAAAEDSVQVRRGVLGRRDWTVPHGSVQTLIVRQGPLQRRMGVATVRIDTAAGGAAGGPHVHDVETNRAEAFVAEVMSRVHALPPRFRREPVVDEVPVTSEP
jgi:putative membrane protein